MEYVAAGDIEAEGVHMLSTSGMLEHVEANPDGSFIVATENGMLYPLQQAAPQANLIEANRMAFCKYMKMITLPKLRDSLREMKFEVSVPAGDCRAGADPDRAHGRDRLAGSSGSSWANRCLGGVLRGRGGAGVTLCPQKAPPGMARAQEETERDEEPRRPRGRRRADHRARDVTKVYPGGHMALDRVSLAIDRGEFVFLVGPTGCGKSTLIKMLIRELEPTEGSVSIAGRDIGALPEKKIPQLRRNIGTVFQDFKLLPDRTVYDNVAYALQVIGASRAEIRDQVPETLRLVGLSTKLHSYPDQLSGGEQQRVSIARAFVNHPPLLLADEPSGNLDPVTSIGIMQLLYRINRTGTTVLVVTHDREMVDKMRRRVIELYEGRVVRDEVSGGYTEESTTEFGLRMRAEMGVGAEGQTNGTRPGTLI